MENNELVVYGQNGEIMECNFKRVDLQNPSTILGYCSDVKDAIGNILDSTSQMTIEIDELTVDEKAIEKISTFDTTLDESEKSKGKNSIIKSVKGFLGKIGLSAFKDVLAEDTYATRYQEYCKLLNEVATAIESQKQNTLNDIELKNNIIKEMTPLIKKLEVMVEVGLKDKEAYDKETEALKAQADPSDLDAQNEIQFRTQVSAIFNNKLNELEKALILYKEQIQTYRIQQNTDMELVMSNESYLRDSVPILKAQGSVMVFNRQQENRITDLARLSEAANTALTNNARDLEQNAQAVVELSLNGGITVETLKELDAALKRGMTIFQKGREQQQQKIAKETQELQALNVSLDGYQQELLNLIDDRTVLEELLKDTGSHSYGPVKKLGTKKPTTKKGRK